MIKTEWPTPKKTRKCHIPIAQRLEHSACDKGVMGLGPIRDVHFFRFTRFPLLQEQLSKVYNGCPWPHTIDISWANIYKQKCLYHQTQYPKSKIGKWDFPVA